MRKLLLSAVSASVLALGAASAGADENSATTCSLATLNGTLAWGGTGTSINTGPFSNSGMESYDGHGHMKYYELQSDGITNHVWKGTGTYTITPNCIATVIYDGDVADAWTYFVAPDGSAYYYNNNLDLGHIGGGRLDRISKALLVQ
jgi:hypothetical protein